MKEISDWLDETYMKFVEQENKDPRRSANEFLQRYVFVMFMKFSLVLSTYICTSGYPG